MEEEWELDFKWLRVRHQIKDRLNRNTLPNLNAILFLIGMQELGFLKEKFTKEEKQDLMHIAVCRLLSQKGYYELNGLDADGWPHWIPTKKLRIKGVAPQEKLLKTLIIQYFQTSDQEEIE